MIYLAIGRRGLGKTTLVYSMARKCPRRIVIDPRGLITSPDARRVTTIEAFDVALVSGVPEIVVTPYDDLQGTFDAVANRVRAICRTSVTDRLMFIVDEARFFRLMDSSAFEYVLRAAPPESVHVAITCHRPLDIPTDIRAIADHWLVFKLTQEHDLRVIDGRCGGLVKRHVAALAPYEYVHWNDGTQEFAVNKHPEGWFVPLRTAGPQPEEILPELPENSGIDSDKLF